MPISSATPTAPETITADWALSVARLMAAIGSTGNLKYLLDYLNYYRTARPAQFIVRDAGTDYTSTSSTLADVDNTNLKISLTTDSNRVLLFASAYIDNNTAASGTILDIKMNGTTRAGGTYGLFNTRAGTSGLQIMTGIAIALFTNVTPGANYWTLQFARDPAAAATAKIHNNGQPIVFGGLEL